MALCSYLGADFLKILAKPEVDYKQANLTVSCTLAQLPVRATDTLPAIIPTLFDPPEGQDAYDYVFDLTGEVRQDRTEMVCSLSSPTSFHFRLTITRSSRSK